MSEAVLSSEEVDAAVAEQGLAWERVGDELVTTVELHDFAAALAFVNGVGAAAEAANHHPDTIHHPNLRRRSTQQQLEFR